MGQITGDKAIEALLKTYYKDGVENLLMRNSPVVKAIGKTRVEGKEQRFAAIYGRGGAVASKARIAEAKAAANSKNAEFIVTPGQMFSIFTFNNKEVQASLSKKGAYMKIAGNKAYAAAEAFRKTLAAAFYGRGFGELEVLGSANAAIVAAASAGATGLKLTLQDSTIMKIDVDSDLVLKKSVAGATEECILTVTSISGNEVTCTLGSTAYAGAGATDVICLRGSMDASGNPNLPMGIDGWLPIVEGRDETGSVWPTFKTTPFCGVNRSVNVEALMGSFYYNSSNTTFKADVEGLLRKVRRHGSKADLIIMNDADWQKLADEIQTSNTYFTQTSTRSKRQANIGMDKLSASFSTNFVDLIYDDPYAPEGKFYVLDKDAVELWTYTNAETVQEDGVSGNNPGKDNPEDYNNKGKENEAFKLLIDDFISVVPGGLTDDGESVRVTYNLFGSFVVLNPSNAGVGILHDATPANVIGYSA